jgi:pimeloyl-ACP methyl ester carboxylesterase
VATFVCIHGSWHGGWCFDPVRLLLEGAGHTVVAPDLPGMGGDAETLRAVTLQDWAGFAADLCRRAAKRPVILVGHSRGGLVVSQAAEIAADAIDGLVYVSAMMLPDGMSRAAFKSLEAPNPEFDAIISPVHDGAGTIVDAQRAGAVFAQLSPPELVDRALSRLVAEPHGPRSTSLRLSPERFGRLRRHYIECTEDRTIRIESQRLMQRLVPGAAVATLTADHSPFLSRTEELAAALLATVGVAIAPV